MALGVGDVHWEQHVDTLIDSLARLNIEFRVTSGAGFSEHGVISSRWRNFSAYTNSRKISTPLYGFIWGRSHAFSMEDSVSTLQRRSIFDR